MIRKVYIDFLRDKASHREFRWLLSRGKQYALIHASHLIRKPLCGPILGTLVTNYSCNYQCSMCDLKERDGELRQQGLRELDTLQIKKVLKAFAGLGTSGIGFTGGEPLLRKDIFELLSYTRSLGMISHLNTNGYYINDRNAENIIDAGVDSLNISLDGARSDTHDSIRGHRGAYDRTVKAIELIIAARKRTRSSLRIKAVAVLQQRNIDEIPGLVRLARELGVDCMEFIPQQPFAGKTGRQQDAGPEFLKKVDQVTDYLLGLGEDAVRIENSTAHLKLFSRSFRSSVSPLQCYAGYNSYAVDCYGEIYPCVPWYNWRRAVGNIRDVDPAEYWYAPAYDKVRDEIRSCRKCYLNCQAELNILFNMIGARLIRTYNASKQDS